MITNIILNISNKFLIAPALLLSIAQIESNMTNINYFNNNHSSYGIMQLELRTAREYMTFVDALALQQPEINITISAMYIKDLASRYELLDEIIASYNRGSVKRINGLYSNQSYVDKVLALYYGKYDKN